MSAASAALRALVRLETLIDAARFRLRTALRPGRPLHILPYRGYGGRTRAFVTGRVLEGPRRPAPSGRRSALANLLAAIRRIRTAEVPRARLALRWQGGACEVHADDEGFFVAWLEPPPADTGSTVRAVEIELLRPRRDPAVRARGEVLVPPRSVRLAVVSDIDDTIVETNVASILRMARTTFLSSARDRLPFPGAAAFYRALHQGPHGGAGNPILYVSRGPWNLYDLLEEYLELQGFPPQPVLLLRDWGLDRRLGDPDHKRRLIHQALDVYPELPFLLIGDSGQRDPEIYAEVVASYPDRVLAVYIRNVTTDAARPQGITALARRVEQAGSTLLLAPDTVAMARHAAGQGWIDPRALPEIGAEAAADEPGSEAAGDRGRAATHATPEGAVDALHRGTEEQDRPPAVIVERPTVGPHPPAAPGGRTKPDGA